MVAGMTASPSFTASFAPSMATWQLVSITPLSMTTPLPVAIIRPDMSITLTRPMLGATSANTFSADRGTTAGTALASTGRAASFTSVESEGRSGARTAGWGSGALVWDTIGGGGIIRAGGISRRIAHHTVTPMRTTMAAIHLPHTPRNIVSDFRWGSLSGRMAGPASDAS